MTDTRYRQLLCAYLVISAAAFSSLAYSTDSSVFQVVLDRALDYKILGYGLDSIGLFCILLVARLVGLVGLFRFKSWGRSVSLCTTLVDLLTFPLSQHPPRFSGIGSGLHEASAIIWGVILAVSYFSAVSHRFGR